MRKLFAGAALVAVMAWATPGQAAPLVHFWSGDGGDVVISSPPSDEPMLMSFSSGSPAVVITPHPVWGDVSPFAGLDLGTAKWISYADTGFEGIVAPNIDPNGPGDRVPENATAHFQRTFNVGGPGILNLYLLADDTAAVRFSGPSGVVFFYDAATTQIDPCSGSTIGCVNQHMFTHNWEGLTPGTYTLDTYAFQTRDDTFGVQYAGSFTPSVPEPASLALFGLGLIGFAPRLRRLWQR